jgi:hypothetical protein
MYSLKRKIVPITLLLVCLGIMLMACASQQADENPSGTGDTIVEEQTPAELFAFTSDSDCSACHAAEVQSGNDSTVLYSFHVDQQEMQCNTCHNDDNEVLTKAHEDYATAKLPSKLKKTEVYVEVCLTCHNMDDLKVKTKDTATLTDSNGVTANPHDLPVSDSHAKRIICMSCHEMHGKNPVNETAPKVCEGCHHQNVYECGTCHR